MKTCSNKNCKNLNPQPLDNFGTQKDKKDGRRSQCRLCRNEIERSKPRTEKDKISSRVRTAKYRKVHAEALKEKREKDKLNLDFKERARQATAKYRLLHPDRVVQQNIKAKESPDYKEKRKKSLHKYKNKDLDGYRRKQNERNSLPENRKKRRESSSRSAKKNLACGLARTMKRYTAKINRIPKWLSEIDYEKIQLIYKECSELQILWDSNDPLQVDHIFPLQGDTVSGLHVPWNLQILPRSLNIKKANKILLEGTELYNQCEDFKKVLIELYKKKNHPFD